jgi:hypothetical protein
MSGNRMLAVILASGLIAYTRLLFNESGVIGQSPGLDLAFIVGTMTTLLLVPALIAALIYGARRLISYLKHQPVAYTWGAIYFPTWVIWAALVGLMIFWAIYDKGGALAFREGGLILLGTLGPVFLGALIFGLFSDGIRWLSKVAEDRQPKREQPKVNPGQDMIQTLQKTRTRDRI